jgi:hypothetical protein
MKTKQCHEINLSPITTKIWPMLKFCRQAKNYMPPIFRYVGINIIKRYMINIATKWLCHVFLVLPETEVINCSIVVNLNRNLSCSEMWKLFEWTFGKTHEIQKVDQPLYSLLNNTEVIQKKVHTNIELHYSCSAYEVSWWQHSYSSIFFFLVLILLCTTHHFHIQFVYPYRPEHTVPTKTNHSGATCWIARVWPGWCFRKR